MYKSADKIPWNLFEGKHADLFPSDTGNVAKPLHMALGSLIIQNRFWFPDRELVEQITGNPYLQYFIRLPGYQDTPPFDASTLVLFRKRITADMLNEANEYLLATFCAGQDCEHQPAMDTPHSVGQKKAPVEFGAKLDMSIDEEDIHCAICIRVESFQDSEANTFVPLSAIPPICVMWRRQQPESRLISRHYLKNPHMYNIKVVRFCRIIIVLTWGCLAIFERKTRLLWI